jgi:hypothetical protein
MGLGRSYPPRAGRKDPCGTDFSQDFTTDGVFQGETRLLMKTASFPNLYGIVLAVLGLVSTVTAADQQKPAAIMSPELRARYGLPAEPVQTSSEPVFDLDFPGGTPQELVAAINQNLGAQPINVVIPEEFARTATESPRVTLPPLHVKGVTVSALFEAVSAASARTDRVRSFATGSEGAPLITEQQLPTSYGFRQVGAGTTPVWVFFYEKPLQEVPPITCRFFQLGPFLETQGIEDITTAVRTGYELLGEEPPQMKFHQETKLLIAVGPEAKLRLIDSALKELKELAPRVTIDPTTGAEIPRPREVPARR